MENEEDFNELNEENDDQNNAETEVSEPKTIVEQSTESDFTATISSSQNLIHGTSITSNKTNELGDKLSGQLSKAVSFADDLEEEGTENEEESSSATPEVLQQLPPSTEEKLEPTLVGDNMKEEEPVLETEVLKPVEEKAEEEASSMQPVEKPNVGQRGSKVSGDFEAHPPEAIIETQPEHRDTPTYSYATVRESRGEAEEEEEEEVYKESSSVVPYEHDKLDRLLYYAKYEGLRNRVPNIKMKNNYLHHKMADYYRKRKMDHVLHETLRSSDTMAFYDNRLDTLGELKDMDNMQRICLTLEIKELRQLKEKKRDEVIRNFKSMLSREKDIGNGLIFTKTGKEIPEKQLERILNRQQREDKKISDLRTLYIKVRDRVTEKQMALNRIEYVAEGLTLIQYEQLKTQNESFAGKIEERNEELNRLRNTCNHVTQVLAHMREKSASLIKRYQELEEVYKGIKKEEIECREILNQVKYRRDYYRRAARQIEEECGLLTKPKLLKDMEDAIHEVNELEKKLKEMQTQFKYQSYQLRAIRRNIEALPPRKDVKKVRSKEKRRGTNVPVEVYKGRPNLIIPILPPIKEIM